MEDQPEENCNNLFEITCAYKDEEGLCASCSMKNKRNFFSAHEAHAFQFQCLQFSWIYQNILKRLQILQPYRFVDRPDRLFSVFIQADA